MEYMEMTRTETTKAAQSKSASPEIEAQATQSHQGHGASGEVPCCCPGCFSFDF